jgi:hypothetical protein
MKLPECCTYQLLVYLHIVKLPHLVVPDPLVRKQKHQTKNLHGVVGCKANTTQLTDPQHQPGASDMIVPWTKYEFRNVKCDKHSDEVSGSTGQARMVLIIRNGHGRSAEQEGERYSTLIHRVWLAFGEFYRLSVHIQSQSDSSTRIL